MICYVINITIILNYNLKRNYTKVFVDVEKKDLNKAKTRPAHVAQWSKHSGAICSKAPRSWNSNVSPGTPA